MNQAHEPAQVPDVSPTGAWLASEAFDSNPAPGQLALQNGRLTFMVVAPGGEKNARWIEQVTGQHGVAERILKGEAVTVVDVPVAEANPSFPPTALGSAMHLMLDETKYRINFYDTGRAAGRARGMGLILSGRRRSKPFRAALKRR